MATPTDPRLNGRVIRLYEHNGLSIREVAVRVGRSKSRVQQILDTNGVQRRPVGRRGKEQ